MSKVRVLYDFKAEADNELDVFTGEELTVLNPNVFEGWMEVRNIRGMNGLVPSTYVETITSNDYSDDDIPPPPANSYGFGVKPAATNAPSWSIPAPTSSYVNQPSLFTNQYPSQTPADQDFDPFSFNNTNNPNSTNTSLTQTIPSSDWDSFLDSSNTAISSSNLPPEVPNSTPLGELTFNTNSNVPSYQSQSSNPVQSRQNSTLPKSHYDDDDSDGFSDEDGSMDRSPKPNQDSSGMKGTFPASSHNTSTNSVGTVSKYKAKNSYGLDVFLVHGAVKSVHESDKFSSIILNEQRQSVWKRLSPPYQVAILGYHSDKKYHGVKKFTSYEIQAKIFPQRVKRRYNHFDWLHERLVEKYPNICIPPLPGKAVTGNFDDDFISKRKAQLELWLNRMSSHPVVGQSEVFVHFLQCDDASSKWKAGKRKAEKDEYRASQWFCTLTVPGESVDTTNNIKERIDKFSRASINLDNCVKNVSSTLEKISSLNSTTFKKEFTGLGKRLEEWGIALSNESLDAPNNSSLSSALITVANTYAQIGNMYGEQGKIDIGPLLDRLYLYRGIIQQMPEICQFEKNAIQTFEELQQRPEKLEGRSLMEVAPRREIISHVTFAEINLFNRDKVDDFNNYMKTYLQQQITFYSEITECLKRAYTAFEKIPTSSPESFNSSFRR